jgi:hypothetical protein
MDLREALVQSIEDLEQRMERNSRLLGVAMSEGRVNQGIEVPLSGDRPQNSRLREVLIEAIEVLEGTRKAFKSKQLEMLRKKMIRALVEEV